MKKSRIHGKIENKFIIKSIKTELFLIYKRL